MPYYTFPLSTFEDRAYNPERLTQEVRAVLNVQLAVGRDPHDPTQSVRVQVDRKLDTVQFGMLKSTLTAHRDDQNHLPTVKAQKFVAIDEKTRALIARGFLWEGQRHSLSENAQKLILGMDQMRNEPAFSYPLKVNSLDDSADAVLHSPEAVHTFALTAMGTIRMIWESGTALKEQVRAATSVAQVNAVIDRRK